MGVAILSGFSVDTARPNTVEPSAWWQWLLMIVPAALVAVRRVDPPVVLAAATVAQAGIWVSDLPEVLLPIVVLLYTSSADAGRRGRVAAVAASIVLTAVTAIGVQIADDVTTYQLPLIALTCGTAMTLGVVSARRRADAERLAATMVEHRLRAEHERQRAIADERAHIARELHDVIGHTLSVIAVRAEAADRVADRDPSAAPAAVEAIAGSARHALDETRRVLAGLRDGAAAELAPPPDLDAIYRLVHDLSDTGIDVTITTDGCGERWLPASVAGGAFRIVQESLTNAVKHGGPTTHVDVMLACGRGELSVTVRNTIDGPSGRSGRGVAGAGLAGMVERANVLGGHLDAGQDGDQFLVHGTLPIGPVDHGASKDEQADEGRPDDQRPDDQRPEDER